MDFTVGDKVVYPSQGVSVIESISDEVFGDSRVMCYRLRLLTTDSLVVVPVGNSTRVGLRRLSERPVIAQIMGRLQAGGGRREGDWKDRYRANLDRLKTGSLDEIVDVLLCLSEVASRKTLSFRERKMFDHARQLLVLEVSEVDGRPSDEVEREVGEALGQVSGSVVAEEPE